MHPRSYIDPNIGTNLGIDVKMAVFTYCIIQNMHSYMNNYMHTYAHATIHVYTHEHIYIHVICVPMHAYVNRNRHPRKQLGHTNNNNFDRHPSIKLVITRMYMKIIKKLK